MLALPPLRYRTPKSDRLLIGAPVRARSIRAREHIFNLRVGDRFGARKNIERTVQSPLMDELELANCAPRTLRCRNWCSNGSIKNGVTSPVAIGRGRNACSVKIGDTWKRPFLANFYRSITWILYPDTACGLALPAISRNVVESWIATA